MNTNNREMMYKPHLSKDDSFFEFTTDFLVHSESELPLGWHDQTEIIRILEGEGTFNITGKTVRVRAGSFVIINPKQIHSASANIGRPLRYQSLKFKYEFFSSFDGDKSYIDYIKPLLDGTAFLPSTIIPAFPIHETVSDIFDQLDASSTSEEYGNEILVRLLMYQLLHTFYKNKFVYRRSSPLKLKATEELVQKTIEYIHENYFDNFTLDYLSELFITSKPHLCRTFKRMTSQTISEYQNSHRIKRACELLSTTTDSITTIAFTVGYSNISYFNQRFKQKTFLTPIEYRQTH